MTRIVSIFTACLALAPFARPAAAQTNYPWCANFADGFGGTNCGFVSYEQCMETVRGSGGFCDENNTYKPQGVRPAEKHMPRKARSRGQSRKPS
jgi:Protein of unknown function (DUF3551)